MTTGDSTPAAATRRGLWRRSRTFLLVAGVLLLTGLLISGLSADSHYPALDPRSPDPDGTRAVVHLLQKQGLATRTVDTMDDLAAALGAPDTTVVLPEPDLLAADQLDRLATVSRPATNRLVLIAPESHALAAFAPGIDLLTVSAGTPKAVTSATAEPRCELPEAVRAGTAELGGLLYRPGPDDTACYPRLDHPSLLHRDTGGPDLLVLGTGHPLTNQRLAQDGNAALALGLLGSRPKLVWYLPDYSSATRLAQPRGLADYVPSGWYWATLQLALAAALTALWRGRRLGPVISEELPVVVRAAETTEGRARLYQRGKARDRAADILRQAARRRLATTLGLAGTTGEPDQAALCAAVAARVNRPAGDLRALLYGNAPTSDAALVRLTDDLDALERQVRQP